MCNNWPCATAVTLNPEESRLSLDTLLATLKAKDTSIFNFTKQLLSYKPSDFPIQKSYREIEASQIAHTDSTLLESNLYHENFPTENRYNTWRRSLRSSNMSVKKSRNINAYWMQLLLNFISRTKNGRTSQVKLQQNTNTGEVLGCNPSAPQKLLPALAAAVTAQAADIK